MKSWGRIVFWLEKYNTIRMNYKILLGNWQKLNVDFQMKIIYLLNYFSFKGNHCSQFHRWLDNILYGVIPRMVEEIHLFQNIFFFFGSSVLDAEIPQLEIHSLALTSWALENTLKVCTQQGPDVVLERVVKNFPSNEAWVVILRWGLSGPPHWAEEVGGGKKEKDQEKGIRGKAKEGEWAGERWPWGSY